MQKGAVPMRKAKIDLQKFEREKEKKLQRKKWILRGIGIAVLVACLIVVGIVCFRKYQEKRQIEYIRENYVEYSACYEDLNSLVEFFNRRYPDEVSRPRRLLVANGDLVDTSGRPISIPQVMKISIKNILDKGFVSENFRWRMITFQVGRIQFDTNDGNYALVYSPEGEPTFLHQEGEDYDILVEHIEGPWYHVMRIN